MNMRVFSRWMVATLAVGGFGYSAAAASDAEIFQSIAGHLDEGGSEYEVVNAGGTLELLRGQVTEVGDEIFKALAAPELEIPADELAEAQSIFNSCWSNLQSSGLFEVRGWGSSSIAVAEGDPTPWYRGRSFILLDWEHAGWVWPMVAPGNRDLSGIAAQLPGSTLAALDFSLDTEKFPKELLDQAELPPEGRAGADSLLRALNGRIEFAAFVVRDDAGKETIAFRLCCPDPKSESLPAEWKGEVKDGRWTVFFPATAKAVWEKALADGETLDKNEAYRQMAAMLPIGEGSCWEFGVGCSDEQILQSLPPDIDPAAAKWLGLYLKLRMGFDDSCLGVARRTDDGIVSEGVSRMDGSAALAVLVGRYAAPMLLAGWLTEVDQEAQDTSVEEVESVEAAGILPVDASMLMVDLGEALSAFQQENGAFPDAEGVGVFSGLADQIGLNAEEAGQLDEMQTCLFNPGDPAALKRPAVTPLAIMLPESGNIVTVLFADGAVESVPMPGVKNFKEAVGFLHARKQLEEPVFRLLIKKAGDADGK